MKRPVRIITAKNSAPFLTMAVAVAFVAAALLATAVPAEAGVNAVNGKDESVLQYAMRGRASREIVELLLDASVEVALPADGGGQLLLDAASAGSGRLVEILFAKGADRNYVNKRGETLLHRASQGGLAPLVEAV